MLVEPPHERQRRSLPPSLHRHIFRISRLRDRTDKSATVSGTELDRYRETTDAVVILLCRCQIEEAVEHRSRVVSRFET